MQACASRGEGGATTDAAPTMTPLSVQYFGGGQTSSSPDSCASSDSLDRTYRLAATPPATTSCWHKGSDSSPHWMPRRTLATT